MMSLKEEQKEWLRRGKRSENDQRVSAGDTDAFERPPHHGERFRCTAKLK